MYWPYTHRNLHKIPQVENPAKDQKFAMDVVGRVLPIRTDTYGVEPLTDWESVANGPPPTFSFPPMEMQQPQHFEEMAVTLNEEADKEMPHERVLN
jgi:hypothetical protein